MPTKQELEIEVARLTDEVATLHADLEAHDAEASPIHGLAEALNSAPPFPGNYDDHVLAIERGFKPAYQAFLARLRQFV